MQNYEHGVMILTSNKSFYLMEEVLEDDPLATKILTRFLHSKNNYVVKIKFN